MDIEIVEPSITLNPVPSDVPYPAGSPEAASGYELVMAMNLIIRQQNQHVAYRRGSRRRYVEPITSEQRARLAVLNTEYQRRRHHWQNGAIEKQVRAQVARNDDDTEIRQEVIEALVLEGKARHVAANLTNTFPKLMAEGRRLNII